MTPEEILQFVVVGAIVVIPALAISARIALRPMVDAVARLRELTMTRDKVQADALAAELKELRATTAELAEEDRALREGGEFYRQLQAPGRD
jgi:hypothetical protein